MRGSGVKVFIVKESGNQLDHGRKSGAPWEVRAAANALSAHGRELRAPHHC